MVRTNLQEFVGDVHVLSNLQVGSNLFANDLAANVLTVDGSIGSTFFIGDGGLLSNIATTLNDIVANPGGNAVSNTLVFESGADVTSNTAIVTYANVGISISNTEPTGEFQLSIGSNIFVNTHASNVLTVVGAIGSDLFIGDGGLLSNIATTIDQIIDQGNTVSNTLIFESGIDATSNTGIVTKKDVGISISNTAPTGEFQFGVGSNLLVNVYSSNVLAIEGNVSAEKMTLGTITVTSAYGLNHVTAQGSVTGDTISLTNATTGLSADSNIVVGGNVTAQTVITSANVEVGNRLKFASNVFVDDLRIADLAANLVTYDKTTGELMDSGGLFANKLAVVSVQPPSVLTANATTIAKHGTYTVTTSSLAANSNAWNAFDGDSAVEWLGSTTSDHIYNGVEYTYSGTSNLFAGNYIQPGVSSAGEWLAIEFPYKTTLRHMKLTPPATYQQYPASANVYATNDSLTWTEVVNWSGVNPGDQQSNVQTIIVNATESFKKYAMVVTKTNGSDTNTALAKWDLFAESFSIDGGQISMAQQPVTGGETMMEQSGPHGRGAAVLKKYPEIAFDASKLDGNDTTNTYTQAGYTVSASTTYITHGVYKAFNGVPNDFFHWETASFANSDGSYSAGTQTFESISGEWLKIQLPNKIKPASINLYRRDFDGQSPKDFKIYASITGSSWTLLTEQTGIDNWTNAAKSYNFDTGIYYKYFAILVTKITRTNSAGAETSGTLGELEIYGYEEDPPAGDTSVDTTFTSIMNTPQTTGANVYVDGSLGETFTNRVVGPTVSNTHTTYVSADKYWELNGQLTSNITMEANTFLSGDAPHSISMWFNSSNLEANVSNSCIFSLATEEKLDSVNLDLQSNTWHNLTYAYQGEGGSRVTYLDGRKVAEDQAEDTFGDYPPFAMTGHSQGGYVVSSSGEHLGIALAWYAFNDSPVLTGSDVTGTYWQSAASSYETTGSYNWISGVGATGVQFTDTAGGEHSGEWIKLEMPHKLRLNYISYLSTYTAYTAKNFVILGSNDDNTWTLLKSVTNGPSTEDVYHDLVINADRSYKYYVVLTSAIHGNGGEVLFANIKFYGHRENDLVRLPDPTNVLKYPHIAMTGPAQRGYVASASSFQQAPYLGFTPATTGASWVSGNTTDYDGGSNDYNATTYRLGALAGGGNTEYGEWLKLELPHKLAVNKMILTADPGPTYGINEAPDAWKIYGSNDDTNWVELLSVTGATPTTSGDTRTISNSTAYKYIAIVITSVHNITTNTRVGGLEYYGTGVDSIPLQIGGGNIDKVANFRVYDKFVGEDQALEIWDAQKDEFGRAKSSMTLHKGRLGIGTTEPEGRLAVADEPDPTTYGLQEFPPKPLVGYKTHIEGHGVFKVYASTDGQGPGYQGWKAFDKTINSVGWHDDGTPYTNGVYAGTQSLAGIKGEWIALKLPYAINIKSAATAPRSGDGLAVRGAGAGVILGSNDGNNWDQLHHFSGLTATDYELTYINNINAPGYYTTFALLVTELAGAPSSTNTNSVNISEIKFFGTREQVTKQSVLHDGQLTLTKSLNVPRIGPALDADDTPRRDRLVVEYNTSTNPTFEGAVRDTSGRGNDGVFRGSASYDATEKAFDIVSSSDIIFSGREIGGVSGDILASVSLWFKAPTLTGGSQILFIHTSAYEARTSFVLNLQANEIRVGHGGTNYTYNAGSWSLGRWYHAVGIKRGTGAIQSDIYDLYLNGVKLALTNAAGTQTMVMGTDQSIIIGSARVGGFAEQFTGEISNVKYYPGLALTASEVKTLYDMGRCDEGHHMVNFSKTRVGIGLGDGEAPRSTLDVRGNVSFGSGSHELRGYFKYNNQPRFSAYSNNGDAYYSGFSSPIVMNSTFYNVGSHYSTSTGAFTAPVTGHYRFSMAPWNNGAQTDLSMWYRTSNSGTWDDIGPYKLLGGSPNGDEMIWRSNMGEGHPTFDLYVPAGYQIGFGPRGGSTVTIYRAHSYFSGELISIV